MEETCHCPHRMHGVLKVTKVILQAAAAVAGFCIANEIRKLNPDPMS